MSQKRRSLVSTAILVLLIIAVAFLYRQNRFLKTTMQLQQVELKQQDQAIDSIKNIRLTDLMSHVLNKIDAESKETSSKTLSDETISRIAALSFASKPYLRVENDSLGSRFLSPERGQLLLMLMRIPIDTPSLDKIMLRSTFANADLRKADLRKAYLEGINLSGADLREANLQDANLQHANLQHANLGAANISNANLRNTDLKRAHISWTNFTGSNLSKAKMDGVISHAAQMGKAKLRGATVQWAKLSGSFMEEANLDSADFRGTILEKVNLEQASMRHMNLFQASMPYANLEHADLTGATLTDLVVAEENWLEQLKVWNITGADDLQKVYNMTAARKNDRAKFRVVKK